jgi:hypothetical protein
MGICLPNKRIDSNKKASVNFALAFFVYELMKLRQLLKYDVIV